MEGIKNISTCRHTWENFSDWCEAVAISLYQPVHKVLTENIDQDLEEQYMRIAAKYGEDINKFPKLLAYVMEELEFFPSDFLGEAFMQLELGSHYQGQFFTPNSVSLMMAKMMLGNVTPREDGTPLTFNEPACGAGGMVINAAISLRDQKINYHDNMHVVCQDISNICFYMSYIQLSLMGISAEVRRGDSLTNEVWLNWRTIMSVMKGFTIDGINAYRELNNRMVTLPEVVEPVIDNIIAIPEVMPISKMIDPMRTKQVSFDAFF